MKKINYLLVAYLFVSFTFLSCSKDENEDEGSGDATVVLNDPISNFTWKAMNSWYNWKDNVPNLADSKKDDIDAYYTYLNGFESPEKLFDDLLFDAGNTDRFSWFIEDYVEQQKSFQGVTTTTGIRRSAPILVPDTESVIIYAQHISTGSPADLAGIKRGNIINEIDGEVMNTTNYASVINKLYSGNTIVVSTAKEENGVLTKLNDFTVTPTEVSDNPVHFSKVFENVNGKKVGYLVYNGFRSSYNDELNAVFTEFKGSGISELILDFRINGGGSVETSAFLASMINKSAGTDTFADLRFNSKHSNENGEYNFGNSLNIYDVSGAKTGSETINRLADITKLYVIVSGNTASASEMIINGLTPFMPVTLIGETTYGKNVGSITLYDSPTSDYTSQPSEKSSHKKAMQPIVFQIFNKLGESDYTQGFAPDIEIEEWMSWRNILPYGDVNEVMLKAALDDIKGVTAKQQFKVDGTQIMDEKSIQKIKFENEMYIDDHFFNEK
ncbi:Peptidase family S41 [Lutibacter agarilyticus]|uniref:Peptidase family S41 n=1 Tax=Lutibacter agarilyticus TaxID=1109740 RepID=A0A238VIX3_9FLAO|nr:S41 family peptidase [Lutibacter agarilyticus]SNR34176.1 Peptidase family S41 [Lutibacter agarilyticus]